ncbi:MAG TPA: DUF6677 family protein [Janthinobacterium sp.]|jgi:hypothetical protein|nr:DUF6677 family protein [Janthinobacterium sp.]
MKRSIKAALLSALVFPGVGHFTLRRPARGCLFLLPAAIGAIYMFRQVMQRVDMVMGKIQDGTLALDPQALSEQISAAPGAEGPMMTAAAVVCVVCWAGSIIDSFLIGDAGPR